MSGRGLMAGWTRLTRASKPSPQPKIPGTIMEHHEWWRKNSRVGFPPPPRHHYLSRLFADAETLQVAPYARLPSSGTSILDLGAHEAVAVGGKAEKSALAFGQVAPSTLQPRCPDPPHTNHVVPGPPIHHLASPLPPQPHTYTTLGLPLALISPRAVGRRVQHVYARERL